MRVGDLAKAMEQIAPLAGAEPWDNVGLLVGDPATPLDGVLLTIDLTTAVAREAAELHCNAVVAYHPPIFKPIKRITAGDGIFDAVRQGIAIYSPHTALDAAPGGTADMLADVLQLQTRQGLPATGDVAPSIELKLVTFVPEDHADRVADAMFAAGAGRIGNYSSCSFRGAGTGTFVGGEGTSPAVGEPGRLERVAEVRLETAVPIANVAAVIEALRKSHPYEEPAYDLVQLAAKPALGGAALIGEMEPVDRRQVIAFIKGKLGLEYVLVAGPTTGTIRRAACCPGSCGDRLAAALAAGAEFYLTGEVRHHDVLHAAEAGMTVVCTLHSNSERAVLRRVRGRLETALPGVRIELSHEDRDPFAIV